MSAIIPILGATRQLDRAAEPATQITPEEVKDASRLARILMGILRDVAALKRRFKPRRLDFEDATFDGTGTTKYRFAHGFNGRVRFWVTGCTSLTPVTVGFGTATIPPALVQHADTDKNTLVLVSFVPCTATLRVEESG